jgi:LmbE family N-acetylglucosaminyl deacetylase
MFSGKQMLMQQQRFWLKSLMKLSHILITYDEIGGYGHPDHIQAHRVAMRASELSTWQIQKIYWNTMPKSVLAEGIAKDERDWFRFLWCRKR